MIFFTIIRRATSVDKSILIYILQVTNKIPIHLRLFGGVNFTLNNFKKLSLVQSLFNIRQEYSLKPKTLLNSVIVDLH